MKKNRKAFHIRRQTESAMAVVLAVLSPGVFPAGLAMAESTGAFTSFAGNRDTRATGSDAGRGVRDPEELEVEDPETEEPGDEVELESGLDVTRATDSDADMADMDLATASDAQQPELATASDLTMLAAEFPVT